jgi:hypothetical protein
MDRNSYTRVDVLRLIFILTDKFNLSCALTNVRTKSGDIYYGIRINKSSIASLIVLIKPYMIPSMYYKIGI